MRYQGILCVPDVDGLRNQILQETHGSHYSINLSSTKMYNDHREVFLSEGLKKEIAEFVAKCQNCQYVKAKHQYQGGLLQEIKVPTWNWKDITWIL